MANLGAMPADEVLQMSLAIPTVNNAEAAITSLDSGQLPRRTDNEIKNYWNTILRKKVQRGSSLAQTVHHELELAQTKATTCSSSILIDLKVDGEIQSKDNAVGDQNCSGGASMPSSNDPFLFNEDMADGWMRGEEIQLAFTWEFGSK
ncbi:transcription factor MYB1-like [Phoenix dactylifera]|uniref:Transcription factor MYB1-like n=1 Tax=Phoenix dactylifera TaxID=42345 RepID=A0A8B9A203_PHODC|nr:transcription factor MYB1-like [Phoenix dactylifera]